MLLRIKCIAERKIFPPEKDDELGFVVCSYRAANASDLPGEVKDNRFTAKGPLLPYSTHSEITLIGDRWDKQADGYTLNCVGYEETVPNTVAAVAAFLETIPGCEKNDATRIINNAPGNNPISAIDGTEIIAKSIKNKHVAERVAQECKLRREKKAEFFYITQFLSKNMSPSVAVDVALKAESIGEIRRDPFKFAVSGEMPYQTAKLVAMSNIVPLNTPNGVKAAIIDVIKQAEGQSSSSSVDEDSATGNTYITIDELLRKTGNVVGMQKDSQFIQDALTELIDDDVCVCDDNKYIYRKVTCEAEYGIAQEVERLMACSVPARDHTLDIYALENKKGSRLGPEQRKAVKIALANPITLLVGGPGTGKTTIEQFIIEVYRLYHSEPVLLVAPTGKAARRMSDATGEPAYTVHKALGVSAGTEVISSDVILDAGLILIDEASMLDAQVSFALFKAIKAGTQVVVVGDTNQLPSVGAGNVLFELLRSKSIPVAALERVYRQKAGSTIATNCARIKRGDANLDYSDTFLFIEAANQDDAVDKIMQAYKDEMAAGLGTEDICLLSPYRRTTKTGVNHLNQTLQKLLVSPSTESMKYGSKEFFLGDKVMLMANREDAANGDVGYITSIQGGKKFTVDYGGGKSTQYNKSDLRDFDLAYGISIHKSQGVEFPTCIIVMMDEHKTMLKRNLIYTAVSRAKKKVIIVGTKSALTQAVETEDVSKRQSRLGDIIAKKLTSKAGA